MKKIFGIDQFLMQMIKITAPHSAKAVKPVQNITHVAGEPDGGEKYLGKWVAEVAIHYNNGDTLMKYLELSGIQKQIKHWRGIAKKFSDDTPYSKGPNPRMVEKAENKLVQLEFLEEERMKSIHEKNDVIGAFVVFNHEESYLRCVEDHQLQKSTNVPLLHMLPYKSFQITFKGKHELQVKRAAEAGDIQFEYLPFHGKNGMRRTINKCYIFAIL